MKLTIERPVTVITPTVGKPELQKAIRSIDNQTYSNITYWVVIDGPDYKEKVFNHIPVNCSKNIQFVSTPENTGKTGGNFYGHRIYAAYPHLINSDYILFLDEDNWFEPDHVETLVTKLEEDNLDFTFSLRKIFDKDGNYLCDDNCESLGKWPIFLSKDIDHFHIDTSSFCWKRDFLQKTCHAWHGEWGADRQYFYSVKDRARFDTNGKHTLCYRLDGNPGSVSKGFFDQGNRIQSEKYGGKFPWIKI